MVGTLGYKIFEQLTKQRIAKQETFLIEAHEALKHGVSKPMRALLFLKALALQMQKFHQHRQPLNQSASLCSRKDM